MRQCTRELQRDTGDEQHNTTRIGPAVPNAALTLLCERRKAFNDGDKLVGRETFDSGDGMEAGEERGRGNGVKRMQRRPSAGVIRHGRGSQRRGGRCLELEDSRQGSVFE